MDKAPNRIRELRLALHWSQQTLAEKVGVTKMTISDLERGQMQLTQQYMRRLAEVLECTTADILPACDYPYRLSDEERDMIDRMRAAKAEEREQLTKLADVVLPWRGPNSESNAA
jgi:transcriptional regulator with XRE-family HTH domain